MGSLVHAQARACAPSMIETAATTGHRLPCLGASAGLGADCVMGLGAGGCSKTIAQVTIQKALNAR